MSDTLAQILAGGTGLAAIYGYLNPNDPNPPVGYQGQIPEFTATREAVPGVYDPARRAGSAGQRYFTDIEYTPKATQQMMSAEQLAAMNDWANSLAAAIGSGTSTPTQTVPAQTAPVASRPTQTVPTQTAPTQTAPTTQTYSDAEVKSYIDGLVSQYGGMTYDAQKAIADAMKMYSVDPAQVARVTGYTPDEVSTAYKSFGYARGGIAALMPQAKKGYYLGGATDGMADEIPANIDGQQEAALSDGEFVIPADVVSHLGNGNSDAGAKRLYEMMDRIRKDRTGNPEQGRRINPSNYLPGVK
jgi:hypothetical protein